MKYLKTFVLLAVAAAALTAFAGTASATITSPTGVAYTGEMEATSTNAHTTGTVKVACKHSSIAAATSAGATTVAVSTLTFTECNPDTVTVLKKGHLTIKKGTGGIISTGMEVTKLTHRVVFGIPVTSHCMFHTDNTPIGTITDSHVTGGHAVIHINGEKTPIPTDGACGSGPATMTGTYTVTKPSNLYVH